METMRANNCFTFHEDAWGCEFLREQYMLWGLGFFHGG